MAKFCPNCGNELTDDAAMCVKCGKVLNSSNVSSNNNSNNNVGKKSNVMAILGFIFSFLFALLGLIFSIMGLKKSEETGTGRGLSIAGIIIASLNMLLGAILVMSGWLVFNNVDEEVTNKTISNRNNIVNIYTDYTLGDTIEFDGLEITLDKEYSFVTIDNRYSEYNNSDVIKIGANIKNVSSDKKKLNMFNYSFFGSKGTQLSRVSSYFDESVDYAGDLKPDASYYKYFYLLYDGDGEYSIDFDNYSEEIEVEFDVTK